MKILVLPTDIYDIISISSHYIYISYHVSSFLKCKITYICVSVYVNVNIHIWKTY